MTKCYSNSECCGYHEHVEPGRPCCEHEISCADPVGQIVPCWDNCKCQAEIESMQESMGACKESIERDITQLDGRMTKLENDAKDFQDTLTGEFGELSEHVNNEIHCLYDRIDEEEARAKAEEARIEGKIDGLDEKIEAEIERAQGAEEQLAGDIDAEIERAEAAEGDLDAKIDAEIAERKSNAVHSADFDPNTKMIDFKNEAGEVIDSINANAFIVDGMVKNVEISNGFLLITWNADGGNKLVTIPLSDIFNPSNYYDKNAVDGLLATRDNTSSTINNNLTTVTNNLNTLTNRVNNTVNADETLEFGQTDTIATVNGVAITVGLPELPPIVASVVVDNGMLFVTDSEGNVTTYSLPAGYINIVNNHDQRIENLENIINGQQDGQDPGLSADVADLLQRVTNLESLWVDNGTTLTAKSGRSATAAGFYDSTMS